MPRGWQERLALFSVGTGTPLRYFAMMPGEAFEEIANAIKEAYDEADLRRLLRTKMDIQLADVTPPAPYEEVVSKLLSWAERNGREAELLRKAAQGRPDNVRMQAILRKYESVIIPEASTGSTR